MNKENTTIKIMKLFRNLIAGALAIFVSTAAQAGEMTKDIAIGGHCPVCYIAAGKAVKGTKEFKATHENQTYLFVNQGALDTFKKDPSKYVPAYGGNCAICMAKGNTVATKGDTFMVHNGRIFLNKGEDLEKMFKGNLAANIKAADMNWKAVQMKKAKMAKKG